MKDQSSSPYIGHRNSFHEDTEINLRQVIADLRYQLKSSNTEKSLLKSNQESLVSKYESLLNDKNDRIKKLEDEFEYLYKERDQMKSKSGNLQQINDDKVKNLLAENLKLKKQIEKVQKDLDEADDSLYKINIKCQKYKSDLDYEKEANNQLEERINSLESDNNELLKHNDDLLKKLQDLTKTSASDMLKFNENLHLKNVSLQKTNNQLQLKIDKLLQHKTSVELLKQKNDNLIKKLNDYEVLQENYSKLEIKKISLETKFSEFLKILKSTDKTSDNINENTLLKFLQDYTHLKNVNLVLEDKLNQAKGEISTLKTNIVELEYQINEELQPIIDKFGYESKSKQETIDKLQAQTNLNVQEIQFLRNSLSKLQSVNMESQKEAVSKSTDEYLSTLEKLVDDYKKENLELKNKISADVNIGDKRPRVDDELRRRSQIENSNIQNENSRLMSTILDLNEEIDNLKTKIINFEKIEEKTEEIRILSLKSNPFSKDQIIKKSTIDALREENNQLIEKFINQGTTEDIPKGVFQRQENDNSILRSKIEGLIKSNLRMKEKFSKNARDIVVTISQFFGFNIEFMKDAINPNEIGSKIKLTSKYAKEGELKNSYIMLDLSAKSLKAFGNSEFTKVCEELFKEWANDQDQMTCVLSALNIKLHQRYALV